MTGGPSACASAAPAGLSAQRDCTITEDEVILQHQALKVSLEQGERCRDTYTFQQRGFQPKVTPTNATVGATAAEFRLVFCFLLEWNIQQLHFLRWKNIRINIIMTLLYFCQLFRDIWCR